MSGKDKAGKGIFSQEMHEVILELDQAITYSINSQMSAIKRMTASAPIS